LIVFYAKVRYKFVLSRSERSRIGLDKVGVLKELPGTAQHYKRTDPVVECRVFRMVEVAFRAKDIAVMAPKVSVLKHDYVLVTV
jgi:hypothetical protein